VKDVEERPVALDDVDKFQATDTWHALCEALEERRESARATVLDVVADERLIRHAQGRIGELDYVLDVFLPYLKEEIEANEKETDNE
jgi:hypothetical protein